MESFALLIPIMALSIPIIAIIANAVTRKYRAAPEEQQEFRDYVKRLEGRVIELEESVRTLSTEVQQIDTDQKFLSRLIEDKSAD